MMKKFSAVFVSTAVLSAALFGALVCAPFAPAQAAGEDYYSSITATSGTELLGQLHDLITTTHTFYTKYENYENYAYQTDPGGSSRSIREFYTHEVMSTGLSGSVGDWNREHVWPKSLSKNLWENNRGGADLHHLRPTEVSLNSTRGNHKFGEVNGGTEARSHSGKLGGYVSGDTFEPLDTSKGDVARIILYMYVHYNSYTSSIFGGHAKTNGNGASNCFGSLPLTQVIDASSDAAAAKLLIQWSKDDPVDEIEKTRNEVVYGVQGNRNPFIDNKDYANAIWGDGTAVGGGTGTGSGSGSGSGTGTTTETSSFHPLTEPQEGTYYLGMKAQDGAYHFLTGVMAASPAQYYMATTTDISGATEVTVAGNNANGWTLQCANGKYIEIELNNGHINAVYKNSSSIKWSWDSEEKLFVWVNGSNKYFLGTHDALTTVGGVDYAQYIDTNWKVVPGTYGTSGGTSTGGGTQGGGTQGGGTSTPTSGFNRLTAPQEGTYLLGMYVNGTYQYATTNFVNTYYIETVTDYSEAAQFVITKDGDQYVIKAGQKYLEIAVVTGSDSKTHINVVYNDSRTAGKGWTWSSEHGIFTWVEDSGTYWIGNYGTHTDSISASDISKLDSSSYIAYFGTYGTASGGTTGGGTQGGSTNPSTDQGSSGGNQQGNTDGSNGTATTEKKGGCKGVVTATSALLLLASTAGVALVSRRKH